MFQLKHRLARTAQQRPGGAPVDTGEDSDFEDGEFEIEFIEVCDGKSADGNQGKVKARFGRRHTHNEELAV